MAKADDADEDEDLDTKVRQVVKDSEKPKALEAEPDKPKALESQPDFLEGFRSILKEFGGKSPDPKEQEETARLQKEERARFLKSLQNIGTMQEEVLANLPALSKEVQPPKYQDLKPRPDVKRQNPMLAFQNAGTILALAASGLTRRPLTAAFSAAAGAMEGFEAGDNQRIKDQLDAWKDANQTTMEQNDIETKRFRAIMEAKNLSYNEKVQRAHLLSQVYQNETAKHALITKGLAGAEEVYQEANKFALDLYKASNTAREHFAAQAQRQEDNRQKREDARLKREQQAYDQEQNRELRREQQAAKQKGKALGGWTGNQGQQTSLRYAAMAEQGLDEMKEAMDKGFTPNELELALNSLLGDPSRKDQSFIGSLFTSGANRLLSEEAQLFFNGARKVEAAILRLETGKAFGKGEMRDVAQRYIRQPGEKIGEKKMTGLEETIDFMYAGTNLPKEAQNKMSAQSMLGGGPPIPYPPPNVVQEAKEAIKKNPGSRSQVLDILRKGGYAIPREL